MNENVIKSISRALDFLVESYNVRIDFIPMRTVSYDDDREMAQEIVKHMKRKEETAPGLHLHSSSPAVAEFIGMVEQSTLMIGMRLHSLILGAAAGVPVIGLEYMPKVKAFMESIGMQEFSHSLENLTHDSLIDSIKKILADYENCSRQLVAKVCEKKQTVCESIDRLLKCNR
jgi:polysaccharide pyruvyl transferase WcaK-like protein